MMLLALECLCKEHRARGVSIRFVERSTMSLVFWNGRAVAGPFALLSGAEDWARRYLPTWRRCVELAIAAAAADCLVPG